ncbi:VOC family protein [Vibrio mimicus]|uniref:VOC family protein n=1 Tax=Vibrio mimicus TaxID=674 RepID=UPI002F9312FD
MFKPNSLILYVSDVEKSTNFYNMIFSCQPVETYQDFTLYFLKDDFMLGLQQKDVIDPKAPDMFGGFELSFSDVKDQDVDFIYEQWKAIGVEIELHPQKLEFGYTVVGKDPDGHRLRVCATDTSDIK